MGQGSDVVIGLELARGAVHAAAFTGAGDQLGRAERSFAVDRAGAVAVGMAEVAPVDVWQATVEALARLARRVPDLARRTVALAITGAPGGCWLVDDDGDPVGPALLGDDRRAARVLADWHRHGSAPAVEALTGNRLHAASPLAQLAWLCRHRQAATETATDAFTAKDWLFFCTTGERTAEPAEALAARGDLRTGLLDPRILDLLGLEAVRHLLPPIEARPSEPGALSTAAAAATGLAVGTPVFLAPPSPLTTALAAGLTPYRTDLALTILGPEATHLRAHAGPPMGAETIWAAPLGPGCYSLTTSGGLANVDWLVGLATGLLADAGLIGVGRAEVASLLQAKATTARPGALRLPPLIGRTDRVSAGRIEGLDAETTIYDLMRATYEGIALASRAAHADLAADPTEIRVVAPSSFGDLGHQLLAAAWPVPVRAVARDVPACAGAAIVATAHLTAQALGAVAASWVEPHLAATRPVDPELRAPYDQRARGRGP